MHPLVTTKVCDIHAITLIVIVYECIFIYSIIAKQYNNLQQVVHISNEFPINSVYF